MLNYWIAASLALLAITTLFCVPAQAQSLAKLSQKPLPEIEFMPQEAFETQTVLYEETPYGDEALSYKIRLPKDWIKQEVAEDKLKLSGYAPLEVALYKSPVRSDEQSFFRLQAIDLPAPITAQNWFLQYLNTNGLTMEGIKVHDANNVEALIVQLERDVTYVVRIMAKIVGDRIVLAKFYVPTSHWSEERVLQAQAIESFALANQDQFEFDQTRRFVFPDIAYFSYPLNWKLQAFHLFSGDRKIVRLIKDAGKEFLDGQIDVQIIPRKVSKGLSDEIAVLHGQYQKLGFTVGPVIAQKEGYKFTDWVTFGAVESYEAVHKKQNQLAAHELWFGVLATDDYFVLASLLTPAKHTDLTIWSENASTFRRVLETMSAVEPKP